MKTNEAISHETAKAAISLSTLVGTGLLVTSQYVPGFWPGLLIGLGGLSIGAGAQIAIDRTRTPPEPRTPVWDDLVRP